MENLFQLAILFKTIDQATRPIREIHKATQSLAEQIEKTQSRFARFKEGLKAFEERAMSLQGIASTAVWAGSFYKVMGAFTELEDASISLKSTFMEAGGAVPELFRAVDEEARRLGAELPGTTADFYQLASIMKQLGIEGKTLAEGGLRSAAYLGAVLKIPYQEAGFYVAKFTQALGIADKDLVSFIDTVQRLGHLGVRVGEMSYSFSKLSGALKVLGWQGIEFSKELAPLVGRFIQLGYSGETVGTNLSSLFLAFLNPEKLNKFTSSLQEFGIQLNLIDAKTGRLKGPVELIAELDKITQAYKKGILSQSQLFEILGRLTGAGGEDLKMLATLVMEGTEGYNKMSEAMVRQADLQSRISLATSSLKNIFEAFTGTMQNVFAVIGSTLAPSLKKITNFLNILSDAIGGFLERHKTLAGIIGWSIGIFALLTIGIMALATVFTAVLFPLKMFISTAGFIGPVLKGAIIAIKAFRAISATLLTTPFGWVVMAVTALIAIGYLLWKNWSKVTHALLGLWRGIKENWRKVLEVFLYISPITAPVIAIRKLIQFISGIDLFSVGKRLIEGLWKGIQSVAMKPVEAMKGVVQKIRDFLPFSPAKEGPFRDLHKIKIIETITETIKPAPAVTAMQKTLYAVKTAIQPLIQPVRQVLEPVRIGTAGAGAIHIQITNNFTINGNISEKQKETITMDLQRTIEKALEKINWNKIRRGF